MLYVRRVTKQYLPYNVIMYETNAALAGNIGVET